MSTQPLYAPLRIHPVPDREPEPVTSTAPVYRMPGQRHLELVPTGAAATRRPLRPLARHVDPFEPRPTPTSQLPEPGGWAAQLALCAFQVIQGSRATAQVARFVTPAVHESLVRRRVGDARRAAHPVRPVRVRRVRLCEPADGVAEVSVVLDDGVRARAVALRIQGLDGRWLVTDLQVG